MALTFAILASVLMLALVFFFFFLFRVLMMRNTVQNITVMSQSYSWFPWPRDHTFCAKTCVILTAVGGSRLLALSCAH